MLVFYVYIIQCNDGSYYMGHTDDLERRWFEHTNGEGAKFTSKRVPLKLVFVQEFATRSDALVVERQIKGWSHAKKKALIEHNWTKLKQLASSYKVPVPFE